MARNASDKHTADELKEMKERERGKMNKEKNKTHKQQRITVFTTGMMRRVDTCDSQSLSERDESQQSHLLSFSLCVSVDRSYLNHMHVVWLS